MDVLKGLSNENIELIIIAIQENTCLWDKAKKEYKDIHVKEVAWGRIAETVELPVERVKKIWTNLRDTRTRYLREDKKTASSGSEAKRGKMESWRWANALDFLFLAEYTARHMRLQHLRNRHLRACETARHQRVSVNNVLSTVTQQWPQDQAALCW